MNLFKDTRQKIIFGLFGIAIALPTLILRNCIGSCTNCYGCLAAGMPALLIASLLLLKRLFNHIEFNKKDNIKKI